MSRDYSVVRAVVVLVGLLGATAQSLAQVKQATNDAKAVFERGVFRLPPVSSPKDAYSIVLEPAGGKAQTLTLPPGATGIEFTAEALPSASWTWRYTVQRAEVLSITVDAPERQLVPYADLLRYGDAVNLSWSHVPGTVRYRVTTKTDKAPHMASAPDWGSPVSVDLSAEESVNTDRRLGFYDLPLKPATRMEWTVSALDADGQPLARSAPRIVESGVPWSKELSDKGWKLQRSDTLSKDNATKAALFGYASNQKANEARSRAYQTEFALIWDGTKQGGDPLFYPRTSLEAKLNSSGPNKNSDALKFRFGGYRQLTSHPAELVANIKYETESKEDTKKGLFELAYTPLLLPLGRYYPTPDPSRTNAAGNYPPNALPPLQWMVQLTVGADVGKTFSVGSSKEVRKTNLRQRATLRLDTKLNFVADTLRIPQADFYLTSTYWHLSRETADEFTYSTVGMTFQFTKELSLEAQYSVGADAPKFAFSRSGTIGLGLKF